MGSINRMAKPSFVRGRPALPPHRKGVQIRHRVLPVTLDALIEISALTGESCGAVLNRLLNKELQRIQLRASRARQASRPGSRRNPE
jgi:hypothetical protein